MMNRRTELHTASRDGKIRAIKKLIKCGVNINAKNNKSCTALLIAAENRRKSIAQCLIEAGADVNCFDRKTKWNVLHYASNYGWLDVMQLLLENGPTRKIINAKNNLHKTPLLIAAEENHHDIVQLLINAGGDVNCCNKEKWTILHFAIKYRWTDVIQSCLKNSANIDAKTDICCTPLLLAAEVFNKDIVELLINAGADIHCHELQKWTVLHHAAKNGSLDIVQSLLDKKANFNAVTDCGNTPLILAAKAGHKEVVECLIKAKADINYKDFVKQSILDYAVINGWPNIVKYVLKNTVKKNAIAYNNLLHIACRSQSFEIVEHLLNAGANINKVWSDGSSLMSDMLKSPEVNVIRFLIEKGACLRPMDYESILTSSALNEHILKDVSISSQAIINNFNYKDLPDLYKLQSSSTNLPRIQKLRIVKNSQTAEAVMDYVKHEIEAKGHCNLLEASPIALKMLVVKSFLIYCNKKQS